MVAAFVIESEYLQNNGDWVPVEPWFCHGYREAAVALRADAANGRYISRARLVGQNLKPDLSWELRADWVLEGPDEWLGARFEALA